MKGTIKMTATFVVNLDDDDVRLAMSRHSIEADGNVTQACVIDARERFHALNDEVLQEKGFDVECITVDEADVKTACEVCGNVGGDEYETHTGVILCAGCVNTALAYRVVQDVLANIEVYDDVLGRTLTALDADDDAMRASGHAYVDSRSAAWDMMRGESYEGACEYVRDIMRRVVHATREPGTIPHT